MVLATPANTIPHLTLLNTVAHQRAKKLIAPVDDLF
jgi:hypothetical protein